TAYVFGDAIDGKVTLPRQAWETAVLNAHGHTPEWTRKHGLAPETRAALAAIDLRFHDLRYEAASRLLEAGWRLHPIQRMTGHTSLAQTAEYLDIAGARSPRLDEALRRALLARAAHSRATAHVQRHTG